MFFHAKSIYENNVYHTDIATMTFVNVTYITEVCLIIVMLKIWGKKCFPSLHLPLIMFQLSKIYLEI